MRIYDRYHRRIPRDARSEDRRRKFKVDLPDYITSEDVIRLQKKQDNRCYHCGIFMNWLERRVSKNGLTLERLDNLLPHVLSNCVLCCKSCNSKKLSPEKSLLTRCFWHWYRKTFEIKMVLDQERRCCFAN